MWKFLKILFKIGLTVYGGGNAVTPVMGKVLVENCILSEDEFKENVIVANITSGTLQAKLALGAGQDYKKNKGALLGAFAISLPRMLLTVILLVLIGYASESILKQISYLSVGISTVISVLLFKFVAKNIDGNKINKWIILVVSVLTSMQEIQKLMGYYINNPLIKNLKPFNVQAINIIVCSVFIVSAISLNKSKLFNIVNIAVGAFYILNSGFNFISTLKYFSIAMFVCSVIYICLSIKSSTCINGSLNLQKPIKLISWFFVVCIPFIVIAMFYNPELPKYITLLFLSTITSFGGGSSYIAEAKVFFVDTHFVSKDFFYNQLLPINYAIPGPTLTKISSGLGYGIGFEKGGVCLGIILAFLFLSVVIFASGLLFILGKHLYKNYGDIAIFDMLKNFIFPVVSGLLIPTIISLFSNIMKILQDNHNNFIGGNILVVCMIVLNIMIQKYKNPPSDFYLISIFGVISLTLLNFI